MLLLQDKYGLILDGRFDQGYVIVAHPSNPEPSIRHAVSAEVPDESTIPITVLPNIRLLSCPDTILDKLAFTWSFVKFLFTAPPKNVQSN